MASKIPERVVEQLRDLVDSQHLVERAVDSVTSYWRQADPEVANWSFTLDELRPRLGSQMLYIRSNSPNIEAPHVATQLELYVRDHRVGFFEFLTTLEGDVAQESGGIMDDFYVDGRAAVLIKRARNRVQGDPQEWVGMVDVRARAGNNFLPDGAVGGYATVLALVRDEEEYRRRVEEFFSRMELNVEVFDDVEPLAARLAFQEVDDETLEQAGALSESSPVVYCTTIHTYGADGDEE